MILHVTETTYGQCCDNARCGLSQYGLAIAAVQVLSDALVLPACPGCGAVEVLRRQHAPHELGQAAHMGSLVGTTFQDTDGIVTEHTVGYHLEPHTLTHRRRIHALATHPHLPTGPSTPIHQG